ncbi:MAG: hypothetical protein LBG44_05785 [Gemmatimonadota bacterium]|jgi:hypothetical protein|nr:hypothetical protein [Gemmatimonadota bacterium]
MNQEDPEFDVIDPLLAEVMTGWREETPTDADVDWDRLRTAILRDATLPLARLHRRSCWYFSRTIAPIAAAAGIAFLLWVGPGVYRERLAPAPEAALPDGIMEIDEGTLLRVLTSDLSEGDFLRLVNGGPESMLSVAIKSP